MLKKLLPFVLLIACFALQGCKTTVSPNSDTTTADEISPPDRNVERQNVEFKGVSFTYNPQIFGEVKMEEVAEYALHEENDKPDSVAPHHRLFTFDLSKDYNEMYIAVYPFKDFPRMYAVNKESVEAAKKENENLKKLLKDKNFRIENQIPYLRFGDAHQDFQVKVKNFNFPNGKGILFLTFWSIEFEFPSNNRLNYVFEGLTNDEKYYVLAEMPVNVAFLPQNTSDEYEGYKIPWGKGLNNENFMKQIAEVNKKIADKLENLPQNEFEPNLDELEKIISTLKIER